MLFNSDREGGGRKGKGEIRWLVVFRDRQPHEAHPQRTPAAPKMPPRQRRLQTPPVRPPAAIPTAVPTVTPAAAPAAAPVAAPAVTPAVIPATDQSELKARPNKSSLSPSKWLANRALPWPRAPGSKPGRTLPWTRTLGSKPGRTPRWTRTPGSKPGRTLVWTRTPGSKAKIGLGLLGAEIGLWFGPGPCVLPWVGANSAPQSGWAAN